MKCCLCKTESPRITSVYHLKALRFKNRLIMHLNIEAKNGPVCDECCEIMLKAIVDSKCLHDENLMPLIDAKRK